MSLLDIFRAEREEGQCDWQVDPDVGYPCHRDTSGLASYMVNDRRYDEIVTGLFVGPEPEDPTYMKPFVGAVLDLREAEAEARHAREQGWQRLGIEYENLPFPDGTLPDEKGLERALEWLGSQHRAGLGCLVHCAAGVSRSPFVVALYLLPEFGYDAEAVARHLLARRPMASPLGPYLEYLEGRARRGDGGTRRRGDEESEGGSEGVRD